MGSINLWGNRGEPIPIPLRNAMVHAFQSRFASVALDYTHLMRAVRYVNLNPVRARLAIRAEDWIWSSVRAHLAGQDDGLVTVRPVLDRVSNFTDLLQPDPDEDYRELRNSEGTGRPLGAEDFVAGLERVLGRKIARRAPGRKPQKTAPREQLELL